MSDFENYLGDVPFDLGLPVSQYTGPDNTCSNCSRMPPTNAPGEPTCDGQTPCKTCKWQGDTWCKYPGSLLPAIFVPPRNTHPITPLRNKRRSSSSSQQATKASRLPACDLCRSRKIKCVTTKSRPSCASCHESKMECTYIGNTATGKTPGPARTSLKRQNVCNPCWKSKCKCDQTRPSCGKCSKSGKSSQCVYPHGPRHGGVTQSPGQEFDQDQRSELAENNISLTDLPAKGSFELNVALVGDWQPRTPGPPSDPGDPLHSFFS